jgi:hypothetical protein
MSNFHKCPVNYSTWENRNKFNIILLSKLKVGYQMLHPPVRLTART